MKEEMKSSAMTESKSHKSNHTKLAIDGGAPIRKSMLAYSRQSISDDDRAAVAKVLDSDFITRGPAVEAFERAIAEYSEMPHAVAFCSATAALHSVMAMMGVSEGVRVITSPITFAATSNSVLYCRGKVEFQDTDVDTMNLDAKSLKNLAKVQAVVAVDFAGNPCDYDALKVHQKNNSFRLISDAAHSLGATYKNKPVGSAADLSVFSFHPVKSITTGEGGMVVLRNKDEAEFLRTFRSHGIIRTQMPGMYRQEFLGYNYHITDIQCALGLSQLKRLPQFVARRTEIAQKYTEFFSKLDGVKTPVVTEGAKSSWHLYPLRLDLGRLSVDRDRILLALHAENIGANVHYIPVYWHPYYMNLGYQRGLCPRAEASYQSELSLPLFPAMSEQDVTEVCQGVKKVVENFLL
jgi:perosamine synthetase